MSVNERIRILRDQLKLSTRKFGKQIGYSGPMISLVENGRKPGDKLLLAICSTFRVNESWLREGKGKMFVPKARSQQSQEKIIADFIRLMLGKLSGSSRQIVLDAIQDLEKREVVKNKNENKIRKPIPTKVTKTPKLPNIKVIPVMGEPEPDEPTKKKADAKKKKRGSKPGVTPRQIVE